MPEKIEETESYLKNRLTIQPVIGMITGTGLGSVTEKISPGCRIPYEDIPHFPISTVEGHKGRLVAGQMAGRPVMAMEGRFHLYEGYGLDEIIFPVRLMARLGVKYLLISSAAGGLNPGFEAGDLMMVTDHINLTGTNPLIGPNLDRFGPRFPDMSRPYDPSLVKMAGKKALELGIPLRQGVYVGVSGPSLETPAETRFLRMIGGDAVGMSTVSEVIVGVHCSLKILSIVVITNVNLPDCMKATSLEEVIRTSNQRGPLLGNLWEDIIGSLPS